MAPPEHLILTLKRMYYDWVQQKTCKCLHDVTFPALLSLPALSEEDEQIVFTEDEKELKEAQRRRQYGLYGVLVHRGLTANSGHYYSFCRESDDSTHQLHLEDSGLSPWIKFNDMKVERSSWAEICRSVANSMSDTMYLLLYKRLSYVVPVKDGETATEADATTSTLPAEDEEAMLLAKAMALSMSAASQQGSATNQDASVDTAEKHHREINPALLAEVERANWQYLRDLMGSSTSSVYVDDLHTMMALRHNLPTDLTADPH